MPTPKLPRELAQQAVDAYNKCIDAGCRPGTPRSPSMEAARLLNLHHSTFENRLKTGARLYGIVPKDAPPLPPVPEREPEPVTAPQIAQRVTERDQSKALRQERDALARELAQATSIREGVLGLIAQPLSPAAFPAPPTSHPQAETVIVFVSDVQYGEVVDLASMDGLNSYNLEIADRRLERVFAATADLMTKHWTGPPPARLLLILGGDMVSGSIHLELARTDELPSMPATKRLAQKIIAGLEHLLERLDCPIDLISIPGNHGRTSFKPESKGYASLSYDTLVAELVEMYFTARHQSKRLTFYIPASGDALFTVYGWQVLASHGDRIGSRGGQGFVGPAATIARGFKKLVADYAARGVHLDLILVGHFHCALELEEGFSNGSLPGPTEYSRDMRFKPRPASQLFLAIHPSRGVTQVRRIQVGTPDEGSLYQAPTKKDRPRYRVPAIMGK